MTRRAALVLGAGVGLAAIYASLHNPVWSKRPARASELEAFAHNHLRLDPETLRRVGAWARSPSGPWSGGAPVFTLGQLEPRAWDEQVRRQFQEGRIQIAEGWILSEQEIAFCAALAEGR